ncbi:MAG: hypothetical protein ACRDLB_03805 [Actinomycetota bacterium]
MADATGGGSPGRTHDERVDALALKLLRSPGENGLDPGDIDAARRAARRMLEDSEARTHDPATTDPEHDGVIRRTSSETSSSGETSHRRAHDGE